MSFELIMPDPDPPEDEEHCKARDLLHELVQTSQAERHRAQDKVRELMRLSEIRQLPLPVGDS